MLTEFVKSVSHPVVGLLSQSPRPAAQLESVQVPFVHEAPPPMNEHRLPHEPQWLTLFCVLVSQPFAACPSQSPYPALQLKMPHVPPAQRGVALARTQAVGQLPQCVGSALTLTSQPSAGRPLQSAKPL